MSEKQLLRSFTRGDIKTALSMLRQNRARSLVTIFGIVIAVAAVILVVGIGQGVRQQVQGQVSKLGRDLVLVRPGTSGPGVSSSIGSLTGPGSVRGLDDRDYRAVVTATGVRQAVPLSTIDGVVKTDESVKHNGPIIATTPELLDVIHHSVKAGSFLEADEGSDNRAVIGADLAVTLFDENVPLGRVFTLHGEEFIVSGIVERFDSNPLLGDADFNSAVFITYRKAQELTQGHAAIYEILAQSRDVDQIDQTANAIEAKLRKVHGGATNFSVLQQGQSVAATDNILDTLTQFTIGAAAIALLIGGIGVMNIMLVSVTERMHEIGIRKAVGATNRQILSQFLLESIVLSAIGGVLGFFAGGAGIFLLKLFSSFQPTMPWVSGLATVVIAIVVGALFGCFPAFKAARKDPIEALRNI